MAAKSPPFLAPQKMESRASEVNIPGMRLSGVRLEKQYYRCACNYTHQEKKKDCRARKSATNVFFPFLLSVEISCLGERLVHDWVLESAVAIKTLHLQFFLGICLFSEFLEQSLSSSS